MFINAHKPPATMLFAVDVAVAAGMRLLARMLARILQMLLLPLRLLLRFFSTVETANTTWRCACSLISFFKRLQTFSSCMVKLDDSSYAQL